MSVNSSLVDRTITHSVILERLKSGETQEVLRLLARLEKDLVRDLENARLTAFRKARYDKLLAQTRETVRGYYRRIRDQQAQQMERLAALESRWTVVSLNQSLSEPIGNIYLDIASVNWTPQQIKAIASDASIGGSQAGTWWAKQATATQRIFADTVKQGLLRGNPTPEIVRSLIGTQANAYTDGTIQLSRHHATMLVRSSISAVSADARDATYQANGDLIQSTRWLSTLDARVTIEWCLPRSGKLYTLKDHKPIGHELPWKEGPGKIHVGCRSTSVAVLKSWSELAGQTVPDADGKTVDALFKEKLRGMGWSEDRIAGARRRMQSASGGPVSKDLDFTSWLRTKPVAFQEDVLGKGKAELFRKNVVTDLASLLDMKGNPLTLAQLKQRYGVPE